jgi:hypothetical protein
VLGLMVPAALRQCNPIWCELPYRQPATSSDKVSRLRRFEPDDPGLAATQRSSVSQRACAGERFMKITSTVRYLVHLAVIVCAIAMPRHALADETPIASGQQSNDKARVEILSAKRTEGDTLTLRFEIINDGNQSLSLALTNIKLVDLVNRRSYSAGVWSSRCRTDPGEHRICWAVFGAPPAAVKAINVQFYEDFGLIPIPLSN